jgi:hypothetical protein
MTATRGTKAVRAGSDWEVATLRYDRNPMDSRWMARLAPKMRRADILPRKSDLKYTRKLSQAHWMPAKPLPAKADHPSMMRNAKRGTGRVWAEASIPGTYWVIPESPAFTGEMRVGQFEGSKLVVGEISFNALGKTCHSDGTLCEAGCETCKAAADAKLAPVDINGKTPATNALEAIEAEAKRSERREIRAHRHAPEVVPVAEVVKIIVAAVPDEVIARRCEIRTAAIEVVAEVVANHEVIVPVPVAAEYIGKHAGSESNSATSYIGKHSATGQMLAGIETAHSVRLSRIVPGELGSVGRSAMAALDSIPPIMRAALGSVRLVDVPVVPSGDITDAGEVIMSDGSTRPLEHRVCKCRKPCPVHRFGMYVLTA